MEVSLFSTKTINCGKKYCYHAKGKCYQLHLALDGKGSEYCSRFYPNGYKTGKVLKRKNGKPVRCQECLDSEAFCKTVPTRCKVNGGEIGKPFILKK